MVERHDLRGIATVKISLGFRNSQVMLYLIASKKSKPIEIPFEFFVKLYCLLRYKTANFPRLIWEALSKKKNHFRDYTSREYGIDTRRRNKIRFCGGSFAVRNLPMKTAFCSTEKNAISVAFFLDKVYII